MTVTVYHNPKCGTSRNVLQMLDERGITPVVIEYLSAPPDRETLVAMHHHGSASGRGGATE